ncbi:MAG: DUF2950 domain-containing protein [Gemmobacter sp.]
MKTKLTPIILAAAFAGFSGAAWAEPATFDTPDAALGAIVAALEAKDPQALLAVFGPEARDLVFTGDDEDDRQTWRDFLMDYRYRHRIATEGETAVIHIGREDWPFPAPLVQVGGKWQFDPEAAREEIELRRIGLNELDVIDLLERAVAVQGRYRQIDYDGDGVMEFAASILSSEGQRDGLYWPEDMGEPLSPIGAFAAQAAADGINIDGVDQGPQPYLGYFYRILTKQGAAAPGGALDYVVNGNMISGHAILAFPAEPGVTGVMSFMVGENGVVYEADLGEDTLAIAAAIDSFNPDDAWAPVE